MIVKIEYANRLSQLAVDANKCLRYAFNTEPPYNEDNSKEQLEFHLNAVINQATELLDELKERKSK